VNSCRERKVSTLGQNVVVVRPLARVRALDGGRVGVRAAAVRAVRALLAHGGQEVVVVVAVAVAVAICGITE